MSSNYDVCKRKFFLFLLPPRRDFALRNVRNLSSRGYYVSVVINKSLSYSIRGEMIKMTECGILSVHKLMPSQNMLIDSRQKCRLSEQRNI